MSTKKKSFFRPSNMLKIGAISLGVTAAAGFALFKGPESWIQPAAYVMLAGAAVSLLAFSAAAVGGLWKLGKKLFGKKKKKASDASPVVAGAAGATVAAGALVSGGVPPTIPANEPVPLVQSEESMAYPSLEDAGFQVLPTAEEAAAAANGDPVSAPVVSGGPSLSGDPVAATGGPELEGILRQVQ